METLKKFYAPVKFTETLTDIDYLQVAPCLNTVKAFTRISNASVYVIDYNKAEFLFVSTSPLFLNGLSCEQVKELGYAYYEQFVDRDDLIRLFEINQAGFDFFHQLPIEERLLHSISYTFHIKQSSNRKVLVNHKLTPILLSPQNNIWLALCIVTPASSNNNEVIIIKENSNIIYQFSEEAKYWKEKDPYTLTEKEQEILRRASQGYTNDEIAQQLFITIDTIKYHKKNIFEKFNVRNTAEAIAFASTHHLL